jgi:hypothetical protein
MKQDLRRFGVPDIVGLQNEAIAKALFDGGMTNPPP